MDWHNEWMTGIKHNPSIDPGALPMGSELSEYVVLAREEAFRALSLYAIASDEMIEMWVPIEAMKKVGWNAQMEQWEGMIENKKYDYRQFERKFLIVFDQHIYVSNDGIIGMDNIRSQVERDLKDQIARQVSEETKKRFPNILIESLVGEDMHWRRPQSPVPLQSSDYRLQKFNDHPHSKDCIDSVAAALSARLLAEKTSEVVPSPNRFRL